MKIKLKVMLFGERQTYDEQIQAAKAAKKPLNQSEQEKLKESLQSVQIAEDIEDIIVTTVFRKAVGERIYCGFYAELCADILRFELEMKGYPAMRSNIKHSNFRRKLLEKCCEQFLCIFTKYEPIEGEDDKESRLRHKERLFGNIDFVGELYRQNLLTD
jgi:hypothetical protein